MAMVAVATYCYGGYMLKVSTLQASALPYIIRNTVTSRRGLHRIHVETMLQHALYHQLLCKHVCVVYSPVCWSRYHVAVISQSKVDC